MLLEELTENQEISKKAANEAKNIKDLEYYS